MSSEKTPDLVVQAAPGLWVFFFFFKHWLRTWMWMYKHHHWLLIYEHLWDGIHYYYYNADSHNLPPLRGAVRLICRGMLNGLYTLRVSIFSIHMSVWSLILTTSCSQYSHKNVQEMLNPSFAAAIKPTSEQTDETQKEKTMSWYPGIIFHPLVSVYPAGIYRLVCVSWCFI